MGWTASISCTGTLPIELKSFIASCDETGSNLRWTTATEKNNNYFTIERSLTGRDFYEVANISGAGNSNREIIYHYNDDIAHVIESPDQHLYYRLKQTDFDNTFHYSKIIHVECADHQLPITVYPNPGNGLFTVTALPVKSKVIICNAFGVALKEFDCAGTTEIDLTDFGKGMYLIQIFGSGTLHVKKVVVNKSTE
jgi:hypothetical protein